MIYYIKLTIHLLFYRKELAKLLGYNSFAEMSMETKMAGSIDNVTNTLQAILEHGICFLFIFFVLKIYLN